MPGQTPTMVETSPSGSVPVAPPPPEAVAESGQLALAATATLLWYGFYLGRLGFVGPGEPPCAFALAMKAGELLRELYQLCPAEINQAPHALVGGSLATLFDHKVSA